MIFSRTWELSLWNAIIKKGRTLSPSFWGTGKRLSIISKHRWPIRITLPALTPTFPSTFPLAHPSTWKPSCLSFQWGQTEVSPVCSSAGWTRAAFTSIWLFVFEGTQGELWLQHQWTALKRRAMGFHIPGFILSEVRGGRSDLSHPSPGQFVRFVGKTSLSSSGSLRKGPGNELSPQSKQKSCLSSN